MTASSKKFVPFFLAMVLVATAVVPAAATSHDRETIVDVALKINADTGEFSILIAALQAADPKVLSILSEYKEYTVFAPTDAAFEAAFEELGIAPEDLLADQETLTRTLMHHVTKGRLYAVDVLAKDKLRMLNGGYLMQDGGVLTDQLLREANIVLTDVEADNGNIHVIDNVVLSKQQFRRSIVDVALEINADTGEFSILIAALQAADPKVLSILSEPKEYTVFAPTDAAFEAAFEELGIAPEDLLADQEMLTRILFYHVTQGRLYAVDVLAKDKLRMMKGGYLMQAGGVLTDGLGREANIVLTDVEADNGNIHVIDNVVLPKY